MVVASNTTVKLFNRCDCVGSRSGITVVIASHDPKVEEAADCVYELRDGRLISSEVRIQPPLWGLQETNQKPDGGQGHCNQQCWHSFLQEIHIRDRVPNAVGDTGSNHVGRGTDQGPVPPKGRANGETIEQVCTEKTAKKSVESKITFGDIDGDGEIEFIQAVGNTIHIIGIVKE